MLVEIDKKLHKHSRSITTEALFPFHFKDTAMKPDITADRLRQWLVGILVATGQKITDETDRQDLLSWLMRCREIVGSDLSKIDKTKTVYGTLDAGKTVKGFARGVSETVRNYKNSDLPLAVKLAIPVTLLAAPFIGTQGAGFAALGSAIGVPVLIILFLGTAGLTSVIESLGSGGAPFIVPVLELIARDEIARRTSAALKNAMKAEPETAKRFRMPQEEDALQEKLLSMDPYDFERHVVSFFQTDGGLAWVTRKSNDLGVDGFAERDDNLLVIQCKRNSPDNPVGGPLVQQFKGVIEENGASMGYLVTTSYFTQAAQDSAAKSDKVRLIDMRELVVWHRTGVPTDFAEKESP